MSGWVYVIIAYLLGCIPFGVLVAKAYGVDLRSKGSGNIGATNAMRVIGKKAGAITLLLDALKGSLGVWLALHFAGREFAIYAAAAAVMGHDFPIFAKFRGGKGVATSFGVLLALSPVVMGLTALIWIATLLLLKYSSVGALVSFAALPFLIYFMNRSDMPFLALAIFLAVIIYIRHSENIKRLINGDESKVSQRNT